jgi:hypothetical protein
MRGIKRLSDTHGREVWRFRNIPPHRGINKLWRCSGFKRPSAFSTQTFAGPSSRTVQPMNSSQDQSELASIICSAASTSLAGTLHPHSHRVRRRWTRVSQLVGLLIARAALPLRFYDTWVCRIGSLCRWAVRRRLRFLAHPIRRFGLGNQHFRTRTQTKKGLEEISCVSPLSHRAVSLKNPGHWT